MSYIRFSESFTMGSETGRSSWYIYGLGENAEGEGQVQIWSNSGEDHESTILTLQEVREALAERDGGAIAGYETSDPANRKLLWEVLEEVAEEEALALSLQNLGNAGKLLQLCSWQHRPKLESLECKAKISVPLPQGGTLQIEMTATKSESRIVLMGPAGRMETGEVKKAMQEIQRMTEPDLSGLDALLEKS